MVKKSPKKSQCCVLRLSFGSVVVPVLCREEKVYAESVNGTCSSE